LFTALKNTASGGINYDSMELWINFSMFTWSKQNWLFEGPVFIQPIRAI